MNQLCHKITESIDAAMWWYGRIEVCVVCGSLVWLVWPACLTALALVDLRDSRVAAGIPLCGNESS